MNARLLILAVLTVVILVLFLTVSAPAQEPQFRMTLGGDCSADRATGDLYHPNDPYCLVDPGLAVPVTASMAPNGPGSGRDDHQDDESLAAQPRALANGSSVTQADIQTKKQDDDSSHAATDEQDNNEPEPNVVAEVEGPINSHDDGGSNAEIDEPAKDRGKDSSNDQDEKQTKIKIDEHPADQKDDLAENQAKDESSSDKQCKKAGRDNVNSQGKHDCSADNPDANSDQERTTDHNQKDKDSNDKVEEQASDQHNQQKSSDKECKNADRDNANSQGNHDCSDDNPDTNSGQQHTTDHNPSEEAPGSDHDKNKEKKD